MIAALVMVAGVFGMNAQSFTPRVEVGAAFSNASIKNQSTSTKIGLRAGAALEISLTDAGMANIYLAPGVTYKMGGYKTSLSNVGAAAGDALNDLAGALGNLTGALVDTGIVDKATSALNGLGSVTTHNISVPVNIGLRAGFSKTLAASVEVGPYFSYALSGKSNSIDIFEGDGAKRFDAGLGVSAALEFSKFYVRLGTEFGFINQSKIANFDTKNKNFYTTIGMRF